MIEEGPILMSSSTIVPGSPNALGEYITAVGNDGSDSRTNKSESELLFQYIVPFGSKANGKN